MGGGILARAIDAGFTAVSTGAAVVRTSRSACSGALLASRAAAFWRSIRARARRSHVEVGPQGQGRLVLAARQVELAGRGQQVAEVGVPDGVTVRLGEEREGLVRLALRPPASGPG